jgi:hypothetical protein
MSVHEVRSPISNPPMPRPRTAENPPAAGSTPTGMSEVDVLRESAAKPLRPRTEYWDFRTASWRSQGALPRPRAGE